MLYRLWYLPLMQKFSQRCIGCAEAALKLSIRQHTAQTAVSISFVVYCEKVIFTLGSTGILSKYSIKTHTTVRRVQFSNFDKVFQCDQVHTKRRLGSGSTANCYSKNPSKPSKSVAKIHLANKQWLTLIPLKYRNRIPHLLNEWKMQNSRDWFGGSDERRRTVLVPGKTRFT